MGPLISIRQTADVAEVRRVKDLVRAAFELSDEVSLLVTQLECKEEGCPSVETVIAILERPSQPWQFKLNKPVAEVTEIDVQGFANLRNKLDFPACPEC